MVEKWVEEAGWRLLSVMDAEGTGPVLQWMVVQQQEVEDRAI